MSISDYTPSKSEKDAFIKEFERAARHTAITMNRMTVSTANNVLRNALENIASSDKFKNANQRKQAYQQVQQAVIALENAEKQVQERTKRANATTNKVNMWDVFNPYKWQSAFDDLTKESRQGWASNTARRLSGGFSFEERLNEKHYSPDTAQLLRQSIKLVQSLESKDSNEEKDDQVRQVEISNQQPLTVDTKPITERLDKVDQTIQTSNKQMVDSVAKFLAPPSKKPIYNLEKDREQASYQNQMQNSFKALSTNTGKIVDLLNKTSSIKPIGHSQTSTAVASGESSILGDALGMGGSMLLGGLAGKIGKLGKAVGRILTTGASKAVSMVKKIPDLFSSAKKGAKLLTTNPRQAADIVKEKLGDTAKASVSAAKDKVTNIADTIKDKIDDNPTLKAVQSKVDKVLTSDKAQQIKYTAKEMASAAKDTAIKTGNQVKDAAIAAAQHVKTHGVNNSIADVLDASKTKSDQLIAGIKNGTDKILTSENVVTAKNKVKAATQPLVDKAQPYVDKIKANPNLQKAKDVAGKLSQHAEVDQVSDALRKGGLKDAAKTIGRFPLAKVAGGLGVVLSASQAVGQYNEQSDLIDKRLKAGIITEEQASDEKARAGAEIAASNAIIGGGTALFGAIGSIGGPLGTAAGAAIGNYLTEGLVNSSIGQLIVKGIGEGVVTLKDLVEGDKKKSADFDPELVRHTDKKDKQQRIEEILESDFAKQLGYNPEALKEYNERLERANNLKPRNWNQFSPEQQKSWYFANAQTIRARMRREGYTDSDNNIDIVDNPSDYQISQGHIDYILEDKEKNQQFKDLLQQHKESLGESFNYNPQVIAAYNRRINEMMGYAPSEFYEWSDQDQLNWLQERAKDIDSEVWWRAKEGMYDLDKVSKKKTKSTKGSVESNFLFESNEKTIDSSTKNPKASQEVSNKVDQASPPEKAEAPSAQQNTKTIDQPVAKAQEPPAVKAQEKQSAPTQNTISVPNAPSASASDPTAPSVSAADPTAPTQWDLKNEEEEAAFFAKFDYNPTVIEEYNRKVNQKLNTTDPSFYNLPESEQNKRRYLQAATIRKNMLRDQRRLKKKNIDTVANPEQFANVDNTKLDSFFADSKTKEQANEYLADVSAELRDDLKDNPQAIASLNRRVSNIVEVAPESVRSLSDSDKLDWFKEQVSGADLDIRSRAGKGYYDSKKWPSKQVVRPSKKTTPDQFVSAATKQGYQDAFTDLTPVKDNSTGEALNQVATKQANQPAPATNNNTVSNVNNVNNNNSVTYAGMSATDNRGYKDMVQETRTVSVF